MRVLAWIGAIAIFLGLALLFDYAGYNTEIKRASIIYEMPESVIRECRPYVPFTPFFAEDPPPWVFVDGKWVAP